jgi:HAE1 family hydrophobic/amphiphilic exporter-1
VITGLALPISVFGAFMVMAAFGFTLNVLTLMALSLAIGILIDDAIVVRENIMRHIGFGKTHARPPSTAPEEIGLAVLATTFCIVAVFLPVAFMGGIIGRFFFQFGIMVSAAVLISLFVSFTLDPMLSSIWYDPQAHGDSRFARAVNAVQDRATGIYRRVLGGALRWPKTTLLIALAAFLGSFALPKYIGFEFVPQADLGEEVVSIERRSARRSSTPRRSSGRSMPRCASSPRSTTPTARSTPATRTERTRRAFTCASSR